MKISSLIASAFIVKTNAYNLLLKEADIGAPLADTSGTRDLDETRTVNLVNVECNYENLIAACIEEYGVEDCDTQTLFGIKKNEEKAKGKVTKLCANALAHNSKVKGKGANAMEFKDITGKGYQHDNEYYDGGTQLNAEYEPVTVAQSSEGFSITDIYDTIAQSKLIEFPDTYLEDNFGNCHSQSVMCCWVQDRQAGDGNGNCEDDDCEEADPMDNTDICYNDFKAAHLSNHVRGGFSIYKDEQEGDTHCHGFAWPDKKMDANYRYRGNVLFFVSMQDHLNTRGYAGAVPGAPMCSCVEKMPVVSRADCTEVGVEETYTFEFSSVQTEVQISDISISFNQCTNNNLEDRFKELAAEGDVTVSASDHFHRHIVGDCDEDVYERFLLSKGYTQIVPPR